MNHDFGFNIQVFAEPLDHPAPPEQRRVMVRVIELPVKNGSQAVITELGRVDGLTPEHLDTVTKSLQALLRGAVQGAVDGLAYRIKNPGLSAIIDKFAAQWSPPGVPKSLLNDGLGDPRPESWRVFSRGDRVASFDRSTAEPSLGTVEARATVGGSRDSQVTVRYDDGDTKDEYDIELVPLLCSDCGEPQFMTPGGACCANGHGGAEPRPPKPW